MVQSSFGRVVAVVVATVSAVVMSSVTASAVPSEAGSAPTGAGSPQQEALAAPGVEVYPRSGRLTLRIHRSAAPARGYRVTVAPAGLTRTGDPGHARPLGCGP